MDNETFLSGHTLLYLLHVAFIFTSLDLIYKQVSETKRTCKMEKVENHVSAVMQ
jgi:hypothetical protein